MNKKLVSLLAMVMIGLLGACSTSENVSQDETVKAESKEGTEAPKTEEGETKEADNQSTSKKAEGSEEEASGALAKQAEEIVIEPVYELSGNWAFQPIDGQANEKVALITIDDAPDKYSVEMAKTLKELGAPAIFFVNGHFLDTPEEEKKLKQIHELGFPIGNHTYSHSSLPALTKEQQYEEIIGLNDRVEEIIGERPEFFRAPFGQNTDYTKQLAEEEGMLLMNWTYGYDWEKDYQSASAIAQIMVETPLLTDGANLLMHDREWTANGLEEIVTGLEEKGYELLDPALIKRP
ncbi:Peptidoglycan/xylan/chitin deacetylase, PgdA/CDA1 family [Thalassobacillus cyri]|uniref:Peptidoglycan/xylan/chitin deacetylase, PgdA/CDA1 family n=1 Tax=Thalassobacillus cyri TaxID=571932 RepID=A0A1H4GQ03_9BACI|nr:polysaccharide deacetylase family protein [Thalassobacillus cyri]SEB11401.1 Peptidoglycan/xylan/chitin deacetylase, PgdA/CDA1 family [Thalassobacillus cyri]